MQFQSLPLIAQNTPLQLGSSERILENMPPGSVRPTTGFHFTASAVWSLPFKGKVTAPTLRFLWFYSVFQQKHTEFNWGWKEAGIPLTTRSITISSNDLLSSAAVTSQRYLAVSDLVALVITNVAGSLITALFSKSPDGRDEKSWTTTSRKTAAAEVEPYPRSSCRSKRNSAYCWWSFSIRCVDLLWIWTQSNMTTQPLQRKRNSRWWVHSGPFWVVCSVISAYC